MSLSTNTFQRIKYLRKEILSLNQEDFAKELNISRSNLGNIETGKVKVTKRISNDICRVFKVRKTWLENGTFPIFEAPPPETAYMEAATSILKDGDLLAMTMLTEYCKLDYDSKNTIRQFVSNILDALQKECNE